MKFAASVAASVRASLDRDCVDRPDNCSEKRDRVAPTIILVTIVFLISWMGNVNGGYFLRDWAPVVFILAALMFSVSLAGMLYTPRSWWSVSATGLFALYAIWTFLSMLWSPNQGAAWLGLSQTSFYVLTFWMVAVLIALGASRACVLLASVAGPSVVAAYTLLTITTRAEDLFERDRLMGSLGYYNGEAAFLLIPFWTAIYLAGSRRVNPIFRGMVLAGTVLGISLAVLTQSRGAMVAMIASLPIFFLLSGQRLRGLLALIPVSVALLVTFTGLNDVYLEFLNRGNSASALHHIVPLVWLTAAGAGLYGLVWSLIDRRWRPSRTMVNATGGVALAAVIVVLLIGVSVSNPHVRSDPLEWAGQKWQAFKTNDRTGQGQSRYLSASGAGRYTLWQVAWKDFASHPVVGVGTLNYTATYYRYRENAVGTIQQPHSLPLEILAERGAVGGALFSGFFITCLTAGLWQRFKHLDTDGKALVGAVVAAITYWLVHSSVEWFWQIPAVMLPALTYLAVLAAPWNKDRMVLPRWPLGPFGAMAALLVVIAVAPLYIADRYLAWSYAETNPRAALMLVEKAEKFNPVDSYLPQREAELALKVKNLSRAEDSYQRSIKLNPAHFQPYKIMALYYEGRQEYVPALSFYRKALALNPLDRDLKRKVEQLEAHTDQ